MILKRQKIIQNTMKMLRAKCLPSIMFILVTILLTNTVDFTPESFIYHQNAALLLLVQ